MEKKRKETITNIDIEKLIDYLPTEYDIIIKLHPNEGLYVNATVILMNACIVSLMN